jgi:hypothetical protein
MLPNHQPDIDFYLAKGDAEAEWGWNEQKWGSPKKKMDIELANMGEYDGYVQQTMAICHARSELCRTLGRMLH